VRERALFYINLLKQKGDEQFLPTEIVSTDDEESMEKDDVKQFIFDSQQVIDIDALEAFVMLQKDKLVTSEDPLQIDLSHLLCSKGEKASQTRGASLKRQMEVEHEELKQNSMSQNQMQQ